MRRRRIICIAMAGVVVLVLALLLSPSVVAAQETPSSGVPAPDIIPQPDSGHTPTEAGDRGGALQLLVLGLVIAGVGGAAVHLVRQSRRARAGSPSPSSTQPAP